MLLSIFTPHWAGTNPFLEDLYETILGQTYQDWEWVIVANNGGIVPAKIRTDSRVIVLNYPQSGDSIGALKSFACGKCTGDVLVEVDADDLLTTDCLEELCRAFTDPEVCFAYSNSAQFKNHTWESYCYSSYWGWNHRPFHYRGHTLTEMISFPPCPQAMRAVYWSPNHVRAWRSIAYRALGGHSSDMAVIDDYDLLCRTYLYEGKMHHIDKCLYLYRVHEAQTTRTKNAIIQEKNGRVYEKYIRTMVETWARRNNLALIDLGAAHGKPEGYIGLDLERSDIRCDLTKGIPLDDNSVGIIRACDFVEHIWDAVSLMNEIHRVLVPGGWAFIDVPSTDGRGAFQDPTHVSFWNQNSFWYYTDPTYAKYVPRITARFQASRVTTWFPSAWHKENAIPYVSAQLLALKPGYWHPGERAGENKWYG